MAPNDSRLEIWGNEFYGTKLEERIWVWSDNEYSTLVTWDEKLINCLIVNIFVIYIYYYLNY